MSNLSYVVDVSVSLDLFDLPLIGFGEMYLY